ncbi:MAG: hypothetical protein AAF288_06220 [Planctomycetota bacterium]
MLDVLKILFDLAELRAVGLDAVAYAALAVVGTVLLLLRLGLGLFLDLDGFGDVDLDAEGSSGFGVFSFLSITAFLMIAGWVGLALRLDQQWEPLPAGIASFGSGTTVMFATAAVMFGVRQMAEEKSFDLKTAVGRTGQVYMTVPESGEGKGQVRVSVSGRSMIVDARSAGPKLEAFTDVRVTEVRDDGVLLVEPVE